MKLTHHYPSKSYRLSTLLVFVLMFFYQQSESQQTWCTTTPTPESPGYYAPIVNEEGPFFVRVYVHVIRMTDGTGGQTPEQVREGMKYLDDAFNEHNIFFVWEDCGNIDYIDDNTLYYSSDPYPVFDINNNPDGIDMYLFPEVPFPNATGSGFASDVVSAEFFVRGNFWDWPYSNLTTSAVISHEMGHCLGLDHTFKGGSSQLVNEPDCQNQELFYDGGDFVCDTPADPNMDFEVNPTSCHWNGQEFDANNDMYDPDETNIMAYSHINCQDHLTTGQGQRMRNLLVSESVLTACLVDFDDTFIDHQFFSAASIGAGNYLVMGDLIVESGASLNIQSGAILNFSEGSKLIVKQNARLSLYGALTAYCGDTWKGVEVWTDHTQSQYYYANISGYAQGTIYGYEGSVIENAEIGVQLWGPEPDQGGGRFIMRGTTFRNNKIGAQTAPYQNFWSYSWPTGWFGQPRSYYGRFTECNYVADENYPHEDPFIFIDLSEVNGIEIQACRFNSTYLPYVPDCADFSHELYGVGIQSYDSGFSVNGKCNSPTIPCTGYDRSEFSGLGIGILNNKLIVNRPYTISRADFEDCYVGIYTREVSGGAITHNEFKLGNLPETECWNDQVGVNWARMIDGIIFQENKFTDNTGSEVHTIGINSYATGEFNNKIRRNTFTGLNYANLAGGKNADFMGDISGLFYECNTNINTAEYDFIVTSVPGSSPDNIRNIQGVYDYIENSVSLPAGNKFSYTGSALYRDFRNVGSSVSQLDYYYFNQNPQVPMNYFFIDITEVTENNPCPIEYCDPPCHMPYDDNNLVSDQQDFLLYHQKYKIAIDGYGSALSSGNSAVAEQKLLDAGAARQERDRLAQNILGYMMKDTINYNRDSLRSWWSNLESLSADLTVVGDYVATNQWAEAVAILDAAPNKYSLMSEDLADLNISKGIYQMIYQKSLHGLDQNDLDNLIPIADGNYVHASGLARSIRELYKVEYYPPVYILPEGEPNNRLIFEDDSESIIYELSAYPNPANDYIVFIWNDLPDIPNLKIYNSIGRTIWEGKISPENEQFILNIEAFPAGVYYYQLYADNNITNAPVGKIIIQSE